MIAHALTILRNEIRRHLGETYGIADSANVVSLGNIAEGVATDKIARETTVRPAWTGSGFPKDLDSANSSIRWPESITTILIAASPSIITAVKAVGR